MLKEYGFLRVGAVSNKLEIANVEYNVKEILECVKTANNEGVEILVFPELSLTGYSCKDLFLSDDLLNNVIKGLKTLKEESKKYDLVFIIGAPLLIDNDLYDCAVSISKGKVLGVTPKTYLKDEENRYFSSGVNLKVNEFIFDNEVIKVSNMLIYKCSNYDFIRYAIDIDSDLDATNSISNYTSLLGANLIINLASSKEEVYKEKYRKQLVELQAKKTLSSYIYASCGVNESSGGNCYLGHLLISEIDGCLKEYNKFNFDSSFIYTDIDLKRVNGERLKSELYKQIDLDVNKEEVYFKLYKNNNELIKEYSKTPFLVNDKEDLERILDIQTYALARRIKHLNNCKMVIGVSGGSDSTLAFLVCLRVCKVLGIDNKNIIGVTMPGFGTTGRTYNNAVNLIKESGATFKEISIVDACKQHYKDIDHDISNFNVTYENAQARERTQILFDLANDLNGIVVGTGDLSELVLGWATYNGDHMSNYGVNVGIVKTLVMKLISKVKDDSEGKIREILEDILNTPITPELLPLDDKGNLVQNSEISVGPYKLHDFFIYHFLTYGASIKKIYYLASLTFKDEYSKEEIKATLTIFVKRFFTQQFKRNCLPDGIKVLNIGVSSEFLRMCSDSSYKMYLKELGECN